MKANHDTCRLLVSEKHDVTINAHGFKIKTQNSKSYLELKSIAD